MHTRLDLPLQLRQDIFTFLETFTKPQTYPQTIIRQYRDIAFELQKKEYKRSVVFTPHVHDGFLFSYGASDACLSYSGT